MEDSPSPVLLAAVTTGTLAPGVPVGSRIDRVGLLAVPTGRLLTARLYEFDRNPPLAQAAPVGRFPASVLLVPCSGGLDNTVAALWIEFEAELPERWEPVTWSEHEVPAWWDRESTPIPIIDCSNFWCLLDEACADEYDLRRDVSMERAQKLVSLSLNTEYEWPRSARYKLVDLGGGHNMLVFRGCAWAGPRGCHWGVRGGRVVSLVAEFGGLES